MKFVLNRSYGIFGLSNEACKILNCDKETYYDFNLRTAPELIKVVEDLGTKKASTTWSNLEIVEIPDGFTDYVIEEHDGIEFVYYVIDGKIVKI